MGPCFALSARAGGRCSKFHTTWHTCKSQLDPLPLASPLVTLKTSQVVIARLLLSSLYTVIGIFSFRKASRPTSNSRCVQFPPLQNKPEAAFQAICQQYERMAFMWWKQFNILWRLTAAADQLNDSLTIHSHPFCFSDQALAAATLRHIHSLARPLSAGWEGDVATLTEGAKTKAQDGEGVRCRGNAEVFGDLGYGGWGEMSVLILRIPDPLLTEPLLQEVYAFVSAVHTQTQTLRVQRALPSFGTTRAESPFSPARHIYAEFSHRFSSHLYSYLSQRQKFNAQGTAWS